MLCDEYQKEAMRTATRAEGEEVDPEVHVAVLALGLAGEAGEVADLIKKTLGHGHALESAVLQKELGDVLWYLAVLAKHFGMSLDGIAAANIHKLRLRYPDGFTRAASIGRTS